ncbi:MAG: RluA family pseudouridine synthase [Planctomycetaceae bacterium]
MPTPSLDVLYCDNHLLVVRKPAGVLVQPDKTNDVTLIDLAKSYLKRRFSKPGNVYAAPVHRLDRPVSGVVVMARTSKAAARLSAQFRDGDVQKIYWAIVVGRVPKTGALTDRLVRVRKNSRVVTGGQGQLAKLTYRRLGIVGEQSAVEISLLSGRHHQIRVQLAAIGHPIVGDRRYGSTIPFPNRTIALHAHAVTIVHPTRQEPLVFQCGVDSHWPHIFDFEPRGSSSRSSATSRE